MKFQRPSAAIMAAASVCLIAGTASAQGPRADGRSKVWVYLSDKGVADADLPRALALLQAAYDPHAIERRRLRRTDAGLFDARDLPVAASYVDGVKGVGSQVCNTSRWLNAVSVLATPEQVLGIETLPFVRSVEPVRAGERRGDVAPPQRLDRPAYGSRDLYGAAEAQLTQINLIALHQQGHTAQDVRVGILDTGFRHDHSAFASVEHPLNIIAEHDFVANDADTGPNIADDPEQFHHGTLILGTLAAYSPGYFIGGAFSAGFILCKTEDVATETPIEEDNYVAGLEFVEQHGGDVVTSSLGYIAWYTQASLDGHTAVTTIAVNVATANGVHCCTAAGNDGNDTDPGTSRLMAPGDAARIITCGAATVTGETAWFSSDGPTADGRVKPEVLALGHNTTTIWYDDTTNLCLASGTSLSTPLVAGAVACLAGAHPDWTVDQMRAALISTASEALTGPDPLFVRGYGMINTAAASGPVCGTSDFDGDGDSGTDADIEAFFACLGGSCCPMCFSGGADFNGDGDTGTDGDIEAFFRILSGGPC